MSKTIPQPEHQKRSFSIARADRAFVGTIVAAAVATAALVIVSQFV